MKDLTLYKDQIECVATCTGISIWQWNKYMKGAIKANGSKIRMMIKKQLPDLYESLGLQYRNPYEYQSKRTATHYIYIWSQIEYFLERF